MLWVFLQDFYLDEEEIGNAHSDAHFRFVCCRSKEDAQQHVTLLQASTNQLESETKKLREDISRYLVCSGTVVAGIGTAL